MAQEFYTNDENPAATIASTHTGEASAALETLHKKVTEFPDFFDSALGAALSDAEKALRRAKTILCALHTQKQV